MNGRPVVQTWMARFGTPGAPLPGSTGTEPRVCAFGGRIEKRFWTRPRGYGVPRPTGGPSTGTSIDKRETLMGYGIGGVLLLILVILAIIYFAKRV